MSGAAANARDQPLATLKASLALLFTRRFGTFWFATLASNIGTWAQLVAQPWLLLGLGASPFLVGLDSFAMDAPVLAFTLVGGLLADRADRRRVITLFQSIQMLCPALIVILLLRDAVQPWMVIALSLVVGITDALSMPSFQSIVPSIVAPGQLAAGLALNSSQFNLSRILGPALAGVLIAGIGLIGCFVASAVSYLPFILIALWILPRQRPPAAAAAESEARHPFAGLGDILHDPPLRGALLTVLATSSLCGALVIFCPVLVKQVFHGGATDFTGAISAFGVGGLAGAFGLLSVHERHDRRRLSNRFAMIYGLVLVLAALTPWLWSLPLLLIVAGLSMSVSNTSANTVLLTQAPARLRGRTVSLFMLAVRGGNAIGGVLSGLAVSAFGVRETLLINGTLALAAHLALSRTWPRAAIPATGA